MDRLLQVVLQKLIRTGNYGLRPREDRRLPLVIRSASLLPSASSHERPSAVS